MNAPTGSAIANPECAQSDQLDLRKFRHMLVEGNRTGKIPPEFSGRWSQKKCPGSWWFDRKVSTSAVLAIHEFCGAAEKKHWRLW
jgi:hypothetical protein